MKVINHLASENHWLAFLMDCGIKNPMYDDSNGFVHDEYRHSFVKQNFPRNQDVANGDDVLLFVAKLEERMKAEEIKREDLVATIRRIDENEKSLHFAIDTLKLMHSEAKLSVQSSTQANVQATVKALDGISIPQLIGRGKREAQKNAREAELDEIRKYFHPEIWPDVRKIYEEQFKLIAETD